MTAYLVFAVLSSVSAPDYADRMPPPAPVATFHLSPGSRPSSTFPKIGDHRPADRRTNQGSRIMPHHSAHGSRQPDSRPGSRSLAVAVPIPSAVPAPTAAQAHAVPTTNMRAERKAASPSVEPEVAPLGSTAKLRPASPPGVSSATTVMAQAVALNGKRRPTPSSRQPPLRHGALLRSRGEKYSRFWRAHSLRPPTCRRPRVPRSVHAADPAFIVTGFQASAFRFSIFPSSLHLLACGKQRSRAFPSASRWAASSAR